MARSVTNARRGFTLVETVLAVVVAGLLMGIAVPRFLAVRQGMRLDAAAYQLAGDLRRAQVEAIKRNQTVVVAKTGASTYNVGFIGARSFDPDITFDAAAMTVSMASFGPPVGGNGLVTVQ